MKHSKLYSKFGKVVDRYTESRDARDKALRVAAAALVELDIAVANSASQATVHAAESRYESSVEALVRLHEIDRAWLNDIVMESNTVVLTVSDPKALTQA
jgi:hypothetical protein